MYLSDYHSVEFFKSKATYPPITTVLVCCKVRTVVIGGCCPCFCLSLLPLVVPLFFFQFQNTKQISNLKSVFVIVKYVLKYIGTWWLGIQLCKILFHYHFHHEIQHT